MKTMKNDATIKFHDDEFNNPKNKEFWKVDHKQNNQKILQSFLDGLYNEDRNCRLYKVHVVHQQSSSRLIIYCNPCKKELSSYDPFISHNQGKAHKKVIQISDEDVNPNIGQLNFKNISQICDIFKEGTLEYQLDTTDHDIIGSHMLYVENFENTELYTCRLCSCIGGNNSKMDQHTAFEHIISENHKKNYLKIIYPQINIMADMDDFHAKVKSIQRKEGRMVSKICGLSNKDVTPISTPESQGSNFPNSAKFNNFHTQTEKIEESITKFAHDLFFIQKDLRTKMNKHPWVQKLIDDHDSCELLCIIIVAMAQKFLLFSEKFDKEFKKPAVKLLNNTEQLCYYDLDG